MPSQCVTYKRVCRHSARRHQQIPKDKRQGFLLFSLGAAFCLIPRVASTQCHNTSLPDDRALITATLSGNISSECGSCWNKRVVICMLTDG